MSDAQQAILRIGDPNRLLAPYSSLPEAHTLRVVANQTDVPVPKLLRSGDDPAAFGAPFLIVSYLTGETLLPRWPGTKDQPPYPHARAVAIDFADNLAGNHGCDWRVTEAATLTPRCHSRNLLPARNRPLGRSRCRTLEELRANCKAHIAPYKCPRSMDLSDEMLLSAAGKTLKSKQRAAVS